MGKERFYRVYTEERLALGRKRPWPHATAIHREQRRPAVARHQIWSMDVAVARGLQPRAALPLLTFLLGFSSADQSPFGLSA